MNLGQATVLKKVITHFIYTLWYTIYILYALYDTIRVIILLYTDPYPHPHPPTPALSAHPPINYNSLPALSACHFSRQTTTRIFMNATWQYYLKKICIIKYAWHLLLGRDGKINLVASIRLLCRAILQSWE